MAAIGIRWLKKWWSLFIISSSSAVLVLVWDYVMYLHDYSIRKFSLVSLDGPFLYGMAALICIGFISFPLFGLLADVWIGRYNAILVGIVLCFLSWIVTGLGYISHFYYTSEVFLMSVFIIMVLFEASGFAIFKANIVQYNIDQLIGASADELHSVIYWHCGSVPLVGALSSLMKYMLSNNYFELFTFIVSGVAVSIVLVSHSFFKHKLENVSLIKNPIKLIVRVLCYARKHKYPENRSALTYWEEEAPSRLDLGKDKYGGPFTEEEVEDVKTTFRVLPFFIVIIAYAFDYHHGWNFPPHSSLLSYFALTDLGSMSCAFFLILMYLLLFRACFYKYIPSMLSRMSIGLLFTLTVSISRMFIIKFTLEPSHVYSILLLPQILEGISFAFIVPASLEFTIAQSPVHSRGVMVGIWYASWGVGYFFSSALRFLFQCQNESTCINFYYHLTTVIVVFIILVVFVVMARRYKHRVRENEVNIVLIADRHYQKYIEQEEKAQY